MALERFYFQFLRLKSQHNMIISKSSILFTGIIIKGFDFIRPTFIRLIRTSFLV